METSIEMPEVMSNKVFLLRVPIPAETSTYKPVSHGKLMELTLDAIETCGFLLEKEIYTYSKDGLRANGKYLLKYGNDSEMSLMIAWQNSYDKSLSLKFAVGTWVFICENGCVSGNMGAFKSKHVGDVQEVTPQSIKEYICGAGETFYRMVDTKEAMKDIQVSRTKVAEILGRMFVEEGIIISTQLNTIKRELDKPTYDYGSPGSVWEFYNYITFSLKDCNPTYWLETQQKVHQYIVKEFNLNKQDS